MTPGLEEQPSSRSSPFPEEKGNKISYSHLQTPHFTVWVTSTCPLGVSFRTLQPRAHSMENPKRWGDVRWELLLAPLPSLSQNLEYNSIALKLPSLQRQDSLLEMAIVRFEAVLKFKFSFFHQMSWWKLIWLKVTSNTPSLSKLNLDPTGKKLFLRNARKCPALSTVPYPSHPLTPQGNDSIYKSSPYYKDFKTS